MELLEITQPHVDKTNFKDGFCADHHWSEFHDLCTRVQLPAVKAIKTQALTGLKVLQAETPWDASKERSFSVACQIVSRL